MLVSLGFLLPPLSSPRKEKEIEEELKENPEKKKGAASRKSLEM